MQKEYWYLIIAAILYGGITAGGQFLANLGMSLYEISFYPTIFMGLFLLILFFHRRQYPLKRKMLPFFLVFGLIGALTILCQFGGIILGVPVAIVAFLLYTQPIWTTIFGKLILGETISARKILSVLIALAGILLLLRSWDSEGTGSPLGIILASFGGVFLSLWIIWGRKSAVDNLHYMTATTGWAIFSSLWLLLLWPIIGFLSQDLIIVRLSTEFPLRYWFYLVLFAFLIHIIPSLFFFKSIQKIDAFTAGIILLLEPVSATILASIIFAQPVGLNIIAGGCLILFSNYLAIQKHY